MSDEIHPFGGKDIVEVLRFYCDVFPDKAVFRLALEEIERLRDGAKTGGRG